MPTRLNTRSTGGAVMASRMVAPFASARRAARTRAVMPAESQNVVAVMSTTRPAAPALRTDSSASRTASALAASISTGNVTTAVRSDHVTGKHASDTAITAPCRFQARAGHISGPRTAGVRDGAASSIMEVLPARRKRLALWAFPARHAGSGDGGYREVKGE